MEAEWLAGVVCLVRDDSKKTYTFVTIDMDVCVILVILYYLYFLILIHISLPLPPRLTPSEPLGCVRT
jgi:hypothetical protein